VKKKNVLAVLAVTSILALSACSGNGQENVANEVPSTEVVEASTTSELEEDTAPSDIGSIFDSSVESFILSFNTYYEEITGVANALSDSNGFIGAMDNHTVYEYHIDDISFIRFVHNPFVQISYQITTGNLNDVIEDSQLDVMDVLISATGIEWNEAIQMVETLMYETEGDGVIRSSYMVVNDVRYTLQRNTMGIHSLTIEPAQ